MVTRPAQFGRPTAAWLALVFVCLPLPAMAEVGIATNRQITSSDLLSLNEVEGLSVSPNGDQLAFQARQADPTTNSYSGAWYVLPIDGNHHPRRVADAGRPIQPIRNGRINGFVRVPAPLWTPDGDWIIFLRYDGRESRLWRARTDGSTSEQLTHTPGDVRAFALSRNTYALSRDGRRLYFEVQPSAPKITHALEQEGLTGYLYDRRFLPAYSTRPLLPAGLTDAPVGPVWLYEFNTGEERLASEREVRDFLSLVEAPLPRGRGDRDPQRGVQSATGALAWLELQHRELRGDLAPRRIVAQRVRETPIPCGADACAGDFILGMWWRNDSELIFARREGNSGAETALYSWTLDTQRTQLLVRTRDKLVGNPSLEWQCSVGGDRLICFVERPHYPRRVVAIDLDTGVEHILFDPNPGFARYSLAEPTLLDIELPSGGSTYGYLVVPRTIPESRLPVVLVTYRCDGFLRGGTGDEYPIFPLAAQGFAVLCLNLPDYDLARARQMNAADYAHWLRGPDEPRMQMILVGLRAAVEEASKLSYIDQRRIAITGLSAGAEAVAYSLFSTPHFATAIMSGVGYEPPDYYLLGLRGQEVLGDWGLRSPLESTDRWEAISLGMNAAHVRAPLLINVSERELLYTLFPVTALEEAGRSVQMYVYPNEHHIKFHPAHRLSIYNRNIDWLSFWLRGVESGLTGDPTQYERWRAMRKQQCRMFGPEGTERSSRPRGHANLTDDELAPWYCRPGALDTVQ